MNKHEEARKDLNYLHIHIENGTDLMPKVRLQNYITSCEATEKAYEEEKKNHQYDNNYMNEVVKDLTKEIEELKEQISEDFTPYEPEGK